MKKKQQNKKVLKVSEAELFEDRNIGAGGVPVYKKGKASKESNDKQKPKPKILILCEGQTEVNYFRGIAESMTYQTTSVFTAVIDIPTVEKDNSDKDTIQFNQSQNLIWFAIRVIKETKKKTNKNFLESIETYLNSIRFEEEEYLNKLRNINTSIQKNDKTKIEELKRKIFVEEKKLKERRQYKEKYLNSLLKSTDSDSNNPFDQIWLVCDNDDNKNEKDNIFTNFFAKAKEFGIHIAYSNRQFENWVLLHFEKNNTIFLESECDKKEKCGSSSVPTPPNCKGNICICGYLRENKLHSKYKKGDWRKENGGNGKCTQEYCYEGLFDLTVKDLLNVTQTQEKVVFEKIRTAIQNAEWLRNQQGNPLPENSKNPYIDVDKLVELLIET